MPVLRCEAEVLSSDNFFVPTNSMREMALRSLRKNAPVPGVRILVQTPGTVANDQPAMKRVRPSRLTRSSGLLPALRTALWNSEMSVTG